MQKNRNLRLHLNLMIISSGYLKIVPGLNLKSNGLLRWKVATVSAVNTTSFEKKAKESKEMGEEAEEDK